MKRFDWPFRLLRSHRKGEASVRSAHSAARPDTEPRNILSQNYGKMAFRLLKNHVSRALRCCRIVGFHAGSRASRECEWSVAFHLRPLTASVTSPHACRHCLGVEMTAEGEIGRWSCSTNDRHIQQCNERTGGPWKIGSLDTSSVHISMIARWLVSKLNGEPGRRSRRRLEQA